MIFAPQFSHSVSKQGKKCEDCHNNSNVEKINSGTINLTWLKNGKVEQVNGVIPVVDAVKYNTVYQNYNNGNWKPIENPPDPKVQYVSFGTPLTKEQLKKLSIPQKTQDRNK